MGARDRAFDALQGAARATWAFLKGLGKHDLGGLSAEFAYYFLLSLFPMLLFFAALLSHPPLCRRPWTWSLPSWVRSSRARW